jgi:hypothetical protein
MDTNYLLKREQISLMMVSRASSAEARHAHKGLARRYGEMLAERSFPHRAFYTNAQPKLDPSENPDLGCADA